MDKKIYTVSRLNQDVQQMLESGFGTIWLQGELSNFSRPGSGHFYFSLKDSRSQIRCAMFKGHNRSLKFRPDNGDAVLVRGKLGLYAARGDFQLIVEHMEPEGAGKLQAAFEATKRELDAKGWFSVENKNPLPALPRTIGVVSSPTGAALRDVLHVLKRRYRQAGIIIYPTLTQGMAAAPNIVNAIKRANQRQDADVLLLVRGGGSLEDLWAFNEISVATAIRDSHIPIVAGIGHEVDVTISDLVSDLRAPTPSAAAELATPDTASLQRRVIDAQRALKRLQIHKLSGLQQKLLQNTARLKQQHPKRRIRDRVQQIDDLERRMQLAWNNHFARYNNRANSALLRLNARSPASQVLAYQNSVKTIKTRLHAAINTHQNCAKSRFEILDRALHNVSPLAVLERGYAIVRKDDKLVTHAASMSLGNEINVRLANGEIQAVVSATRPTES